MDGKTFKSKNDMKQFKYLWIALLIASVFIMCDDDKNKEDVKPQPISDYQIKAINGGAVISYTMPNDKNILYVMAEYERNGQTYIERSSLYNNTVTIEGLNTTGAVYAKLYTVNYYETKSDPLPIEFTPLDSPISIAYSSLVKKAGFGGIYLEWENISQTELAIRLMVKEDGQWVDKEVYFSSLSEGRTFREFEDKSTDFGISIEDKWGNISDTASVTLTPIREVEVYPLTHRLDIPFDKIAQNATYTRAKLYDHINGNNSWFADPPESDRSSTFTLDLQDVYLLSRVKFWARQLAADGVSRLSPYASGRVPLVMEFYGSAEIPADKLNDKGYWLHPLTEKEFTHTGVEVSSPSFTDEWVFLGRFTRERLDLLGHSNEEIYRITDAGEEFLFPEDAKPVRYIRVVILEIAGGVPAPGGSFQIGELNFWGNNKVLE